MSCSDVYCCVIMCRVFQLETSSEKLVMTVIC